jgi:glycosyltransferase involved in cell wall biosynthesis
VRFTARLRKEGHVVLLAAGGDGELWDAAAGNDIPTRRLNHLVRELNAIEDARAVTEIRRLIKGFAPDIVYLHSTKAGVLGSIACSREGVPWTAYRIGGWAFLEPMAGWRRWLYRLAEQWSARRIDVIVTVHPGDQQLAKRLHIKPRHSLMTVANGLDADTFEEQRLSREAARDQLQLPREAFVFGTVANAYPSKGLLAYLEVADRVLRGLHDARVVILGDGPGFNELVARRSALDTRNRIHLAGHVDDASRLHAAFDAFVLPSRKEGMPWALLEAMASGVPCIVTNVGACAWVLGHDGGIVVAKEDPSALEAAMRELAMDDVRRARLAAKGPIIVQERFDWETTYRGHCAALRLGF